MKRSIRLAGHSTSLALEPAFWTALEALARGRGQSLAILVAEQDAGRGTRPLASHLRVLCLERRGHVTEAQAQQPVKPTTGDNM